MNTNPRVDAYIARTADFARPILEHLRKVVHEAAPDIEETIKWGMPHFERKGMVCGMAAFKRHCAFGFWQSKLVLGAEMAASEAAMGNFGCITTVADLPPKKVLIGYVKKAVALNEAGVKRAARARTAPTRRVTASTRRVTAPADMVAAFRRNAKARKTFDAFSYTNKKEYVDWVTEAKRANTRTRRLGQAIAWMAKGKPRHWKYRSGQRRAGDPRTSLSPGPRASARGRAGRRST